MVRRLLSSIEPLESRIAPAALTAINPLPDLVAGMGKTSAVIDLGNIYAEQSPSAYHSVVQFTTNFDVDPVTAGLQAGVIQIELFDDVAPQTVQNFLNYVNSLNTKGDYNGIFFHRSVNQTGLQVLQAGGFDVSTPSTHIATGPTVHNEYNEAYQNVEGTIALAKTGAGPNTGSSEFFFNMGDNSSTLGGNNNGGYAVFGKVKSGYDVLQKIFARPLVDETVATNNGALGTVPYQGAYDPNPDGNAATPSPALKAANYITITSAKTVAPANAVSPNVDFTVTSIFDHGTSNTSALVKQTLVGDKLTLTFDTTKSGVADITVHAVNHVTGDIGDETFSVTLKPNLITAGTGDSFQPVSGPGDDGFGQAAITNNGASALVGKYTVNYYLSAVTATDTAGTTLDNSDILLLSADHDVNLASGKSMILSDPLTISKTLVGEQTTYHIITNITAADGNTVSELYSDDQATTAGSAHILTNTFGTVVSGNSVVRSHSSITYLDAAGQTVVATLTGPGLGQLTPVYDSLHNLVGTNLDFYNTSAATVITLKSVTPAAGATGTPHTGIDTIRVNEDLLGNAVPIGTLNLGLVDLTGNLFATGGVKALTLGDVLRVTRIDPNNYDYTLTDSHTILLGNSTPLAKVLPVVKLGSVDNTVFNSAQVLTSLSMTSWLNDVLQDSSTLAGVKSFTVAGNMQANLGISAAYGDSAFMNTNASTTVATTLFKVGGVLNASTVKIAGNVGTVDVGAIYGSRFLVGADAVPSQVAEFNSIRTIASFIVRGVAGENISMSDSQIAAANITSIKVSGVVESAAGSDKWGFVADKIGTYTRAAVTAAQSSDGEAWAATTLKNLNTGTADARGQYELRLL